MSDGLKRQIEKPPEFYGNTFLWKYVAPRKKLSRTVAKQIRQYMEKQSKITTKPIIILPLERPQ
jgi:hypothetical protein